MHTVILKTDTERLFREAVERAADLLRAGQLVALPTETVYGLAANALDAAAVSRIFEVKGRPAHNPIIVHVASVALAQRCVSHWPEVADKLAAAFWPGPLTLVLPRSKEIPDVVTAGGDTVGVRWPSHPFIQEVIRTCGLPLAAPSANPASGISPTTAEHVKSLRGRIALIVDGGPSQVGIESTVLDLSRHPIQVLRPGMIQEQTLQAVMGAGDERYLLEHPWRDPLRSHEPLRSPGQLERHYSPRARLLVWSWQDEPDLKGRIAHAHFPLGKTHVIAHTRIPGGGGFARVSVIPHDAEAFARAIYAELHRCDEEGAELIVIEALPAEPAWQGIADRLRRAAYQG